PGGAELYRRATREWMGTQATHVDKLARVWPGYLEAFRSRCGLSFEGLSLWVHEGGWTPFPTLLNYLLTGSGGVVTNAEARVQDRYLSRAVTGVLRMDLSGALVPQARRQQVDLLRWSGSAAEAIETLGGRLAEGFDPAEVPIEGGSIDLCHSGGALEHYTPSQLLSFLRECHRVLKPGGIASHVLDHRDHLHHADHRYPFLGHLALTAPVYRAWSGHPLGYHNRLRPSQVMRLFEDAGFAQIAVRRMVLPSRRYVEGDAALEGSRGLPRLLLAPRFRRIEEVDLRTAAGHYLYRKVPLVRRRKRPERLGAAQP
ncbi:MAG: class I SAM-dependent methyltransferase, partial [Myxococcaceae bacterium]